MRFDLLATLTRKFQSPSVILCLITLSLQVHTHDWTVIFKKVIFLLFLNVSVCLAMCTWVYLLLQARIGHQALWGCSYSMIKAATWYELNSGPLQKESILLTIETALLGPIMLAFVLLFMLFWEIKFCSSRLHKKCSYTDSPSQPQLC